MCFTCQVFASDKGSHSLLVVVPDSPWPRVRALLDRSSEKHNSYLTMDLDIPFRPRTIGFKSQSHHLRGHEKQIAKFLGLTMSEIHQTIKEELAEWPETIINGPRGDKIIKASERDISIEVCSAAIEICHVWAAHVALELIES